MSFNKATSFNLYLITIERNNKIKSRNKTISKKTIEISMSVSPKTSLQYEITILEI